MQVCRALAISEVASSSVTELYQTGRGKKASVIPMQSKRDFCCPYVKKNKKLYVVLAIRVQEGLI